ncbi:hypothetical protein APHAL10511_004205 [Amanita phalloides]|nr:hypothetical protein APHAL10511_004205 [Amanita phalloides]
MAGDVYHEVTGSFTSPYTIPPFYVPEAVFEYLPSGEHITFTGYIGPTDTTNGTEDPCHGLLGIFLLTDHAMCWKSFVCGDFSRMGDTHTTFGKVINKKLHCILRGLQHLP